jgi:hypothetical protein
LLSQIALQRNPPANNTNTKVNVAWHRGVNNFGNAPTGANLFGTFWNPPIYTITNNIVRTRLNGDLTFSYNGFPVNASGLFGIGLNNFLQVTRH